MFVGNNESIAGPVFVASGGGKTALTCSAAEEDALKEVALAEKTSATTEEKNTFRLSANSDADIGDIVIAIGSPSLRAQTQVFSSFFCLGTGTSPTMSERLVRWHPGSLKTARNEAPDEQNRRTPHCLSTSYVLEKITPSAKVQ